jgi:hypothetical protein
MCGGNGGLVGGLEFAGFWLNHTENEQHLRYLGFARSYADMLHVPPIYVPLDIEGGLLRWGPNPGHWHSELVGGVLAFKRASDNKTFYVLIAEVHFDSSGLLDGSPYWTKLASGSAERYRFEWVAADDPNPTNFVDVCPAIDAVDDDLWINTNGEQIDAVNAFAFEGDKYDPETRKITQPSTAPYAAWLNIACVGSLAAKMDLSRRTNASSDGVTYVSTIDDDREGLVHAWAAEYCGSGSSFTHTGHKLRIRDKKGWLPKAAPIGWLDGWLMPKPTYEAVWDANGAVCLDTPRMAVDDPNIPPDDKIEDKILATCGSRPPPCSKQSWFPDHWQDHGQFLTATFP